MIGKKQYKTKDTCLIHNDLITPLEGSDWTAERAKQ